jgi:hypothetical protein
MRFDVSGNQLPALFYVTALVANHSVFHLGAMSPAWILVLSLAVIGIAVLVPHLDIPGSRRAPLNRLSVLIGLAIVAPAAASLLLGWNREFPFSGDQSFHVKQAYYMAYWWALPIGTPPVGILGRTLGFEAFYELLAKPWQLLWSRAVILAVILIVTWQWHRRAAAIWTVAFASVVFIAWGAFEHSIYLRYPGAGYVLDLPFVVPAFLTGNVELSGRIPNIAAVTVWLFVLRPLLLRRWPDVPILPAAAFLFWQKDVLYYLDSTYLEPWAFVFTFMAVELVVAHGRQGTPLACLMVGAAACFKEPFIMALPFVWLTGLWPWTSLRDAFRLSVTAFAGGFPFVFYFFARKSIDLSDIVIDRTYDFFFSSGTFLTYGQEFLHRMAVAFPGPSAITAIAALAVIPFLLCYASRGRFQLLCLVAAGAALILFFAFDYFTQGWPGYFRFFLPALPYLAAGVVALGYFLTPRNASIAGIAVLILQSYSAYVAVARSAGPGSDRNFVEHYDAALVFPMKLLLAEARRMGYLPTHATVIANQPDETVRSVPGIDVAFGPLGELYCACNAQHPYVMALFVRYANLNARFSDGVIVNPRIFVLPYDNDKIWRENRAARPACLVRLRQTCAHVIERLEGGEIVGALGIR